MSGGKTLDNNLASGVVVILDGMDRLQYQPGSLGHCSACLQPITNLSRMKVERNSFRPMRQADF